jgi:DNA adenine methylase
MSINGGPVATGFRSQNSLKSRYATPATDLLNHDLWTVARRLKNIQILNQDALKVLKRYRKAADALIYFDPTYLPDTRVQKKGYGKFEETVKFHIEAADILHELPGMVIVSGYQSELYVDLYESHGWRRVDKEAQVNGGDSKTESLWLSPAILKYRNLPLLSHLEEAPIEP